MLLLLLAQVASASPSAIAVPAQNLISLEDYPPIALMNGWQGDVGFDLTVGPDGRVKECAILRSSNHAVLDEATCKIATRRARFEPAADGSAPLDRHFQSHVNWRLGN